MISNIAYESVILYLKYHFDLDQQESALLVYLFVNYLYFIYLFICIMCSYYTSALLLFPSWDNV